MEVIDSDIAAEKPPGSPQGLSVVTRQGKRLHCDKGFTLVELIVVAAIIGVLVLMAMPALSHFITLVKVTSAKTEIRGIEKEIWARVVDQNSFPDSLADIGLDDMRDPWDRPYQYLKIGNPGVPRLKPLGIDNLNTDFDLFSVGPNGVFQPMIDDPQSKDDIVRASNGNWIGEGRKF